MSAPQDPLSAGYSTGLFDIMADLNSFLYSCCLPCVVSATVRAKLDERDVTIIDYCCGSSGYSNRQTLRVKNKKEMSPLTDCVAFCCCPGCALAQDVREFNGGVYFTAPLTDIAPKN